MNISRVRNYMTLVNLYSVRVSNELGAAHPRTAKFSVVVAVISSSLTGLLLSLVLMVTRNQYPSLFSADNEVQSLVMQLTPLLAISILVNSIQPTLSGNNLFTNKYANNSSDFVNILFTIYSGIICMFMSNFWVNIQELPLELDGKLQWLM